MKTGKNKRLQEKCRWTYDDDDGYYDFHSTECGEAHYFGEGNVVENKHRFCPYCGRKIKEVQRLAQK